VRLWHRGAQKHRFSSRQSKSRSGMACGEASWLKLGGASTGCLAAWRNEKSMEGMEMEIARVQYHSRGV